MFRFFALALLPVAYAQFSPNKSVQFVAHCRPSSAPLDLLNIVFSFVNVTPGALLTKAEAAGNPSSYLPTQRSFPFVIAIVDPECKPGAILAVASQSSSIPQPTNLSAPLMEYTTQPASWFGSSQSINSHLTLHLRRRC